MLPGTPQDEYSAWAWFELQNKTVSKWMKNQMNHRILELEEILKVKIFI
jgi:hypothetical protein